MSQVTALLKAVYEIKNEEMVQSMTAIRAAVWAEEKDFKKITSGKVEEKPQEGIPKVPESWIT